MGMMETVIEIPTEHEQNVFGQFDVYAKKIERSLHVTLIARDEHVKIMGEAARVEKAKSVLANLVKLSERGGGIHRTAGRLYTFTCNGRQRRQCIGD